MLNPEQREKDIDEEFRYRMNSKFKYEGKLND